MRSEQLSRSSPEKYTGWQEKELKWVDCCSLCRCRRATSWKLRNLRKENEPNWRNEREVKETEVWSLLLLVVSPPNSSFFLLLHHRHFTCKLTFAPHTLIFACVCVWIAGEVVSFLRLVWHLKVNEGKNWLSQRFSRLRLTSVFRDGNLVNLWTLSFRPQKKKKKKRRIHFGNKLN